MLRQISFLRSWTDLACTPQDFQILLTRCSTRDCFRLFNIVFSSINTPAPRSSVIYTLASQRDELALYRLVQWRLSHLLVFIHRSYQAEEKWFSHVAPDKCFFSLYRCFWLRLLTASVANYDVNGAMIYIFVVAFMLGMQILTRSTELEDERDRLEIWIISRWIKRRSWKLILRRKFSTFIEERSFSTWRFDMQSAVHSVLASFTTSNARRYDSLDPRLNVVKSCFSASFSPKSLNRSRWTQYSALTQPSLSTVTTMNFNRLGTYLHDLRQII